VEIGPKLARTLETAHGWCISRYAASVAKANPAARAAVAPINSGVSISVGSSPFSFAVGLAMDSPIAPAELDEVETFFRSRGLPPRIDICPYTDPTLLPLLARRGYTPSEVTSVLAASLDGALRQPLPCGADLRWAEECDCDAWVDVVAKGFFNSDPGRMARVRMAALFRVPDSMNVIVTVGGEIAAVAGGMLPENGQVAALFGSSVLPQFRRIGLHAAMIHFRLECARLAGCTLAVSSATPGSDSQRNLMQCGFVLCYEKITYVARNGTQAAAASATSGAPRPTSSFRTSGEA
jgi:Acetyltransferase (GNAT) family